MGKTRTTESDEASAIDIGQARRYLTAIDGTGDKNPKVYITAIQQKPDASDHGRTLNEFGRMTDVLAWATRMNARGYGIFAVVNETDGDGREASNIVSVRGVWNDCDDGPPEEYPLRPTMRVWTSEGKAQDHWLIDGSMTFDAHKQVLERLVADYAGDKGAKGLPRILRVPGFLNWKYRKPFLVRMETHSGEAYTARELASAFPKINGSRTSKATKAPTQSVLRQLRGHEEFNAELVRSALKHIPADDYDTYWTVVIAIKRGSDLSDEGKEIAREWAEQSDKFDADEFERRWARGKEGDGDRTIKLGTLFRLAQDLGFEFPNSTDLTKTPLIETDDDGLSAIQWGVRVRRKEWDKDNRSELLSRMNKEHAVVSIGGSVRYLHRAQDHKGNEELRFLRTEDMRALYAAVLVPYGDGWATAFDLWKQWPKRYQYAGIGMFPGKARVPNGYLNLWMGFAVDPRKGDWSLFRKHLHERVCGGDNVHFDWLMDWLAHLVQRPEEKPGSAIVLKSAAKGTGKTMLNTILKRILGVHASSVSKAEHVVGRFNGHLQRTLLLGVEEAFWAGSKPAEGVIKNLITESEIKIEQKGVDAYDATNFTRLIFTSNEKWAVPVGVDERRFLVLEVNNPDANKAAYFDPIWEQMENGGTEAMLHDLLQRQIRANLRRPPETRGLIEQRKHSLDGVSRWLWTVAKDGELHDHENSKPIVLSQDHEKAVPCSVVIEAARRACNHYEGRSVDVHLGALLREVGVSKTREGGGTRRRMYVFPKYGELRTAVKRHLRVTL
jgi:hypothetical protein